METDDYYGCNIHQFCQKLFAVITEMLWLFLTRQNQHKELLIFCRDPVPRWTTNVTAAASGRLLKHVTVVLIIPLRGATLSASLAAGRISNETTVLLYAKRSANVTLSEMCASGVLSDCAERQSTIWSLLTSCSKTKRQGNSHISTANIS